MRDRRALFLPVGHTEDIPPVGTDRGSKKSFPARPKGFQMSDLVKEAARDFSLPADFLRKDSPAQKSLLQDVTQAVGKVPIVRLNRVSDLCQQHDLYLKLESCNPGGSIKEKNAVYLVNDAEEKGLLKPGGTIVESSSGNFGVGLAIVGAARGYRVMIVVDAKTAPPMRRMLAAYGAELVDVPLSAADKNGSMQVARMEKAKALSREIPGAWYPCQHLNPANPHAHTIYTAKEIEKAFGGAPDAIVVGISTAGQLAGIASYFREHYPAVEIVGVDVAGSVVLGTPAHPYKMTGVGLSFVPPNFHTEHLDAAFSISDALGFSFCHALAKKEGLLLGGSTGAILAAGLSYARLQRRRKSILMVNPDRGDRYLETIFNTEWLKKNELRILEGEALSLAVRDLAPVFYRKKSEWELRQHVAV